MLYDHYDPERANANYMQPGWHRSKVKNVELRTSPNKGTTGLRATMQNAEGQTISDTFWLTNADGSPSAAVWRLAIFAKACGLTDAEMRTYDDQNPQHHRRLMGRSVNVKVVKVSRAKSDGTTGEYSEVGEYELPTGGQPTGTPVIDAPPPPSDDEAPADEDGIPF